MWKSWCSDFYSHLLVTCWWLGSARRTLIQRLSYIVFVSNRGIYRFTGFSKHMLQQAAWHKKKLSIATMNSRKGKDFKQSALAPPGQRKSPQVSMGISLWEGIAWHEKQIYLATRGLLQIKGYPKLICKGRSGPERASLLPNSPTSGRDLPSSLRQHCHIPPTPLFLLYLSPSPFHPLHSLTCSSGSVHWHVGHLSSLPTSSTAAHVGQNCFVTAINQPLSL